MKTRFKLQDTLPEGDRDQRYFIAVAMSEWPEGFRRRLDDIPKTSHARRHLEAIMSAVGQYKIRLYGILDGYEDYLKSKENGNEAQQPFHREYQGQ